MTIMAFAGKITDIIAIIAKLNGMTLGKYVGLIEIRSKQ